MSDGRPTGACAQAVLGRRRLCSRNARCVPAAEVRRSKAGRARECGVAAHAVSWRRREASADRRSVRASSATESVPWPPGWPANAGADPRLSTAILQVCLGFDIPPGAGADTNSASNGPTNKRGPWRRMRPSCRVGAVVVACGGFPSPMWSVARVMSGVRCALRCGAATSALRRAAPGQLSVHSSTSALYAHIGRT